MESVNNPLPDSCSFCPQNLIVRQSIQKVFSTLTWIQNPIAIKPYSGIDHMSNQRKVEFVNGNFGVQSLCGGHGKISSKSWFRPKGSVCLEFWFSKLVEFLTAITHKSLTVWGRIMDHRKSERVAYHNGIWDFQSFGQSETQKLGSVQS
jgi:hypothetical protein